MPRVRDCSMWMVVSVALFIILLFSHSDKVLPEGSMPLVSITSTKSTHGPLNIQQRMARSEALWEESVRRRVAVMQEFPDPNNISLFPATNKATYHTVPMSVWDFVAPSYNCPWDLQRVGRIGDGGKWLCGMAKFVESKRPCVVYSMGVRDESTFEEEMIERTNCMIYAYDPAVSEMGPQMTAEALKSVVFTQAYVGAENKPTANPPMYTLTEMMKMNKHTYIDVLKMDIEYYEFEVVEQFLKDFGADVPIGQLLVEIHVFKDHDLTTNSILEWWKKLEAVGFRASFTEPNLLWVTQALGKERRIMPRLAEYVFINARDPNNLLLEE